MDTYPATKQRAALLGFAEALGSRAAVLGRDECGDWRINGKAGHIYACPEGFQLCCLPASARAWGFAKQAMSSFARVTQDGDDEGWLVMARPPSASEAEIIRAKLGIAKKREVSDTERERLMSMGNRFPSRRPYVVSDLIALKSPSDVDPVS